MMSQPPENPFYPVPTDNTNYPSWQQTPQIWGNAGQQTRPETDAPPFPQPGSLPKNYNFPASRPDNTNPAAPGQSAYADLPTS
ncbi:MAG: hypothetical protein ACRDHZ_09435, partial [Ktedonobacteraceae bacterium]